MNVYESLNDAFYNTLNTIKEVGFEVSPRGRNTKELLGYTFAINDVTDRIISSDVRGTNIFYCIGNFLWVLAQSNDVDFISYYNPRGYDFSDDGKILRGAYGKRIFDFDGVNQWHQCFKELKCDPDSRRAIITFHLPQHDWSGSLDTPCTASIQFLIRNNKLVLINHMRSQSAAMVMPYDIFLMTMLQEIMACELGIEASYYIHMCNSIHFFENEYNLVDEILLDNSLSIKPQMNPMPKETSIISIKPLIKYEKQIRNMAIALKYNPNVILDTNYWLGELRNLNLPNYWSQIGKLLIAKAIEFSGGDNKIFWEDNIQKPFYSYK